MKIFNWVHRRFIRHKDGKLVGNAKKNCVHVNSDVDDDKPFLLEKKAATSFDHHHVFDGWNEGILTIGTFGYEDNINHELQNDDDLSSFYKQELTKKDDDEEEEEVNPLVLHAACNAYDDYYEGEGYLMMGMNNKMLLMEGRDLKKFRTTLAELFSADSDQEELHEKQGINKGGEVIKEKSTRPIYCKLQRLVRRVVKRKVHPDMGLVHKHNPNNSKVVLNKCASTSASSASLFPTQDANI